MAHTVQSADIARAPTYARADARMISTVPVVIAYAALWLGCLGLAAVAGRVLYGDGAYFVLQHLIAPHRFDDYDVHRSFASFITQAPILFGQRLGFERVASYAALYALGVLVFPAVLFLLALFWARTQPLLFAATAFAIVTFGFGVNFINTEANLFFALVWTCAVILALRAPHPNVRAIVLPAVAFALLRVYEGMLLVGPVLTLWSIAAVPRANDVREKMGLVMAALLFLIGGLIGLGGFLAPRDISNAASFAASAAAYIHNPQALLLLSIVFVTPVLVNPRSRFRALWVAAALIGGLGFVWRVATLQGYYAYTLYYENRSFLALLLPVCIAVLLCIYIVRPRAIYASQRAAQSLVWVLIPLVAAVAGDLLGTYRWHTYMNTFCRVLERTSGQSSGVEELWRSGALTGWAWTHPTMSVLLRRQGSDAIIRDEPGQWQPFDPAKPMSIAYRGFCEAPLWRRSPPMSLAQPISFRSGAYPRYVSKVRGLSRPEGWATWSDAKTVEVVLKQELPRNFDLKLGIAAVFGDNRGSTFGVRVDAVQKSFVVDTTPLEVVLSFDNVVGARVISIDVPRPQSPLEAGRSTDPRQLGVALTSLTIVPR